MDLESTTLPIELYPYVQHLILYTLFTELSIFFYLLFRNHGKTVFQKQFRCLSVAGNLPSAECTVIDLTAAAGRTVGL